MLRKIVTVEQNYMRSHGQVISSAAFVLLLLAASASAQDTNTIPEVPRFQQVTEKLYRSGQPREGGLKRLHGSGINTIINLRGASEQTRAEETEARALGFNYFNVALPNWGRPQDSRIQRVLQLISAPENGRVLVHCKDGVDRTGMIVAIYRLTHDGWTTRDALAEAERDGMRSTQWWMRDYIKDYGNQVVKLGPESVLKSPQAGDDFDDRIGAGMRVVERGTFRARKAAGHWLRKFPLR
jgi:protein tyrosine phosphatase (PTP) superfamily phosphohydrolase (DUF442 family)